MYCIVGIENVNYVNKSGREVRGTKLHLLCPEEPTDKRIKGQRVESEYVSEAVPVLGLNIGDHIDLFYNKYGRVADIQLVK